jgi:transglutaminase-like putative cysteine protease
MAKPEPATLWLVGPLLMALLPQFLFLPVGVSTAAGLLVLWRLSPIWRKDSTSQRLLRFALIPVAAFGVFLEHHTLFGPQGGVSLLVLMVVLKLLESQDRRDHLIMVLAGFFLLMSTFIHDQRLPVALWLALTATLFTASLVATQSHALPPFRKAFGLGAGLILQAVPLALLLFVLFPRIPSPIGGLIHTQQARTGLSDSMSPGSISQLIRSDAIAFRAAFSTAGVDGHQLYWRGPVLWDYDGRTWRRAHPGREQVPAQSLGRPLEYAITLEPDNLSWLPTTGLVTKLTLPGAHETADQEWLAARPVRDRERYSVQAWLDYRLEPELSPARQARALALPAGFNPKTIALGRRWANGKLSPYAIINGALRYFREQPFHYTLNPPTLGHDAVDDFMFDSRRGFCEHYAGAFTVLMRAAGIPARVVTGYQGGEYNPIGGYWIIRQQDAHAWSEVWLAGQGWIRVDPTAAVAPSRVELGLAASLPELDQTVLDLPAAWFRPVRQTWDFINNGWNQWVLGYDFERQQRALSALSPSLANLRNMLWALLAGMAMLLGGLSLYLFRPTRRPRLDEVARLYGHFLRRLARTGLDKGQAEGAEDFARRASGRRPDLARDIEHITWLYIGLRYDTARPVEIVEFRRLIRAFRPGAKPR